ncbi:MAG: hypothetical protein JSW11_01640 [Candidatus Heimdallarchaeota archaeon]|nr:MAG: hypothetical protein JSW11_01640 [Candidatus Heimdallarchaeota archaeon]
MVEKTLVKNPAITIAQMIKLEPKPEPLFLSGDFLETLRPPNAEKSSAVMILAHSTKIIRIIPTKSPKVLKVKIEFYNGTLFLRELGIVLNRNNIKTLYSTTICFHDPPCGPYETYIDSGDLQISEDQLKSELLTIPSIGNVEVTDVDWDF